MSVEESEIAEITSLVWESVLDMAVAPDADAAGRLIANGDELVGAQVRINGAWEGRVALFCSPALARALTATLFMVSDAEVDEEQLKDAIGELANMIGGNLKALLPGPSKLSLPESLADDDSSPTETASMGFECNGQPLIITVGHN